MARETDHFDRFERVSAVRLTERGLTAELHSALTTERLRVELCRPDVVRFAISRGGEFDPSTGSGHRQPPTFAVCVDPLADPVDFVVEESADQVLLVSDRLRVSVGLDPFRLDVHRPDGTPVAETATDAAGRPWAYATLNDAFEVRRRSAVADAFYGLGEKAGRGNRQGREFTMWNTDVLSPSETLEFTRDRSPDDPRADRESVEFDPFYVNIPLLHHLRDADGTVAGSFLDNGYRGHYDLTCPHEHRFGSEGGQYVEYVLAGPSMGEVLASYTWLTGRVSPPPRWALGFHQCRWAAYSQEDVVELGRRHRAAGIPLDTLWLDIEYMDGYRVFTWDRELFPDHEGMLRDLAAEGIRVITIIDPGVKFEPGYPVFDEGHRHDLFCRTEGGGTYVGQVWPGDTAFPDFVTEEARAWWGELNAAHVRSGLAGIWNDMNEPATGTIPGIPMRFGGGRYSHERYRNQYALLMAMGTRAGLLASMPTRRTFILSRAGFAGIQRYAANWMGDNLSRWDHLRLSIAMGAGMGVSGQPFVGADVGGFRGDSSGELLARWTQYACFTPFFRNHNELGMADQYAWSFGPDVEELVRQAVRRRYRLLPYLATAFVQASETGEPVHRPMVYDDQRDPAVRDVDDQFRCGRDLLVAPAVEPGVAAREVYLPAGRWYPWALLGEDHGVPIEGPAHIEVPTPADRIPVFARGGAVVPLWPEAPASTEGYHPEVVDLHVFAPGADGTWVSELVEDDGLTFAYADGAFLRTRFELTRAGTTLRLDATVTGDGYPEFRRTAFRIVVHSDDGVEGDGIEGDGVEITDVPNPGRPFSVELRLKAR